MRNIYLLRVFFGINFYLKYRRSYFGYLWGLLNPIFMISATAFIFSSILHRDFSEYIYYVFAGMIPWLYISQTIFSASNVYIVNEALIRKVKIQMAILPISNLLVSLFDNLTTCLIYVILLGLKNHEISTKLIQLLPAYMIITFFCMGCALIASTLTVYFRDLQWLIQMGMQSIFFLTPVLYRPQILDSNAQLIVQLNPLSPIILLFSSIFMDQFVEVNLWISSSLISIVTFLIGLYVYWVNRNKIIFRL